MNQTIRIFGLIGALFLLVLDGFRFPAAALQPQETQGTVFLLNRRSNPVEEISDGDLVQLRAVIAEGAPESIEAAFALDGQTVSSCTISRGERACTTAPFLSLGWHWGPGGEALPARVLKAEIGGVETGSLQVRVKPRPVVMVHGFASDWTAWSNYLEPDGYLASAGIPGYAVGDGQLPGRMNTGSLDAPQGRTNTIQQNAAILGQYIAQVRQETGAEMVDLLAHSMGGLITRYYIAEVMEERDVAQLIMLGSPMAGTGCANLPASLGLYLPATLEIRPSYVEEIFNQQVRARKGMAFHALAGNPILEAFKSPCTAVPTDLVVSQQSVSAIALDFQVMPVLHTELNTSEQVFSEFVLPLLRQDPAQYVELPDPPQAQQEPPVQFTRLYTGHLVPGESQVVEVRIEDGVTVASFALYDTSRSLDVEVRGASGNVIELTAEQNGLVVVSDPSALLYLGYGFQNPKPGVWNVKLLTSQDTPPGGADYALTAYMVGGVHLEASALPILPRVDEQVSLEAGLTLNGAALPIQSAAALIQPPTGEKTALALDLQESGARVAWQPAVEGLYGIDLLVTGTLPDGTAIERTAFLVVQAQPVAPPTRITLFVALILVLAVSAAFVITGVLILIRRKGRQR